MIYGVSASVWYRADEFCFKLAWVGKWRFLGIHLKIGEVSFFFSLSSMNTEVNKNK